MSGWNFICIICFFLPQYLAKKADDHCSQFHGTNGNSLVECQAFDLDPNYYECYDAFYKDSYVKMLQYWCWNRLDNDETILKNLNISTAYLDDDVLFQQIHQPFTSIIRNNGNHTICDSNENWVSNYTDTWFYCPTSSGIPVAQFRRCPGNPEW